MVRACDLRWRRANKAFRAHAAHENLRSMSERTLYAPQEPFHQGHLRVSDLHEIYFEESGNPHGKPVVFVHGGPGSGTEPKQRGFFDPERYRIVLFDQRGCGKSRPHASLDHNTTWDLVADMEQLRAHLKIAKWQVFGGSWGSTLALAYAQTHPAAVSELVLRGIFLLRKHEIDWFYQSGCSALFADAWEDYLAPIPQAERAALVPAYYKRLTSDDSAVRARAAQAWSVWEGRTSCLLPNEGLISRMGGDVFAEAFARIECHYFMHGGWFGAEHAPDGKSRALLDRMDQIRQIPAVIVQGRYDVVCPMQSAWDLSKAWPEAKLTIVRDAGHSAFEKGILAELLAATDAFAAHA
jgi:proline iminopeptidase